jgi:predicted transcriptional regulator
MLTKTLVKKHLEKFPEEFSLDDLVEQLIIVQKIENGLKDSEEGKTISEDELDQEVQKWFE